MDKKLIDYIQNLTRSDRKTLGQKALKLSEEVGELAKVILPYENAYATTHRFVEREKILEEIADCYLVLTSIAYDLSFDYEDLEKMVAKKVKKWASLQDREVSYPIPYEIHVTVKISASVDEFKNACRDLGVKPIFLDLQMRNSDAVIKDLMTSSVVIGDNRTAYEEMKRISSGLSAAGFEVLREKIETVPWHPAAPWDSSQPMPLNCYFESHLNVLLSADREEVLTCIAKAHSAHKSKNAFKVYEDGSYTIMVTLRDYTATHDSFREKLRLLKEELLLSDFSIEKEIVEFSVYDSRVSHDADWLTGSSEGNS